MGYTKATMESAPSSARREAPEERQETAVEPQESLELQAYLERKRTAELALRAAMQQKVDAEKLAGIQSALGMVEERSPSSDLDLEISQLESQLIEAEANYPGNWTELLQRRMNNPAIQEQFRRTRQETLPSLKEDVPGALDKVNKFQSHYEEQMDSLQDNIDSVFNVTEIGNAADFHKEPTHLGTGNFGKPGAVFLDATHRDGRPLTPRQKMIIEAHEKGHGLRDFQGSDANEIRGSLDFSVLDEQERVATEKDPKDRFRNYLAKPEEIVERMSQFKNYFGFEGEESFTDKHLAYAREHYVPDTGLDNRMSEFLSGVTPATEQAFMRVVNKYAV